MREPLLSKYDTDTQERIQQLHQELNHILSSCSKNVVNVATTMKLIKAKVTVWENDPLLEEFVPNFKNIARPLYFLSRAIEDERPHDTFEALGRILEQVYELRNDLSTLLHEIKCAKARAEQS